MEQFVELGGPGSQGADSGEVALVALQERQAVEAGVGGGGGTPYRAKPTAGVTAGCKLTHRGCL